MKIMDKLIEKTKLELTEASKNLTVEQAASFYEWMTVEYENYMALTRYNALKTLSKFKSIYSDYIPMVEVLEKNIDSYGSLKCFYQASISLTSTP